MNRYSTPTTYKRIVPDRGCGFILKRIYELSKDFWSSDFLYCADVYPTKQDVYAGTRWANRPGFASLLWSSLIKDGLIESNGGMQEYKYCSFYRNPRIGTRAAGRYAHGKYAVCYHLTPKGRGILFDMMNRVIAKNKTQPNLNVVGSVAEFDAKKDGRELPQTAKVNKGHEYDSLKNMTKTDLICEYRNVANEADQLHARLFLHENNFVCNGIDYADYYYSVCARRDALAKEVRRREKNETRDILEKEAADCVNLATDYAGENQKLRTEKDILKKEAIDCAKLAADYAGENQKLRAEKEDLNARLKKLALRLEWIEREVVDAKAILAE